jgi:hypothetical protein
VEIHHPEKDAFMLLQAEIFSRKSACHLQESIFAAHDRTEHKPLGIDVIGENLIET